MAASSSSSTKRPTVKTSSILKSVPINLLIEENGESDQESEEKEEKKAIRKTPPSIPKQKKKSKLSFFFLLKIFFWAFFGSLFVFVCLQDVWKGEESYVLRGLGLRAPPAPPPEPKFEPSPLITFHPRKDGCIKLSTDEIQKLMFSDAQWNHTLQSMYYWMNHYNGMEALTAFHVNSPFCFILLRQVDQSLLGLFNLKFLAYQESHFVSRQETSISCPSVSRNVDRASYIKVEYYDTEGKMMIERFQNQQAYALQATGFYLAGLSICEYTDKGIRTLEQLINHP
jgi:peptide deformylase